MFTEKNPWEEVAQMYDPNEKDCLFSKSKQYVCSGDKDAIEAFNSKLSNPDDTDKIVMNIPAEPWWGNPLKANLIILSLNPGYVPKVNEKLAKVLQANDDLRKRIIEFKKNTLLLKEDSCMAANDNAYPVSTKDAVNMLGDWYWYNKLEHLRKAVIINGIVMDEEEFYKKIALIEYHGYSSITSNKTFPTKNKSLESQHYIREMIKYIAENNEVRFLIMRSKGKWEEFLGDIMVNQKKKFIIKENKSMSQSISPKNLEDGNAKSNGQNSSNNKYWEIVKFLIESKINE